MFPPVVLQAVEAVTRRIGSFAKKNSAFRHCVNLAGKAKAREVIQEISVKATCLLQPIYFLGWNRKPSRKSSACSRPAATRNPRRDGSFRTKNSNTAVCVWPCSR